MTRVEDTLVKIIGQRDETSKDVAHLLKVWAYAHTIGIEEGLDEKTQYTLETAAVIHDISCPLCREKYGDTNGKHQEAESPVLVEEFLKDLNMPDDIKKRVNYLVSHHHTIENVDGMDYRILLEADFLVNADEMKMPKESIINADKVIFKTKTGKNLLKIYSIYE